MMEYLAQITRKRNMLIKWVAGIPDKYVVYIYSILGRLGVACRWCIKTLACSLSTSIS